MEMALETVILAIVAAMMYAGTQFIKKWPTDNPEQFDWEKFTATLCIGGVIGVIAAMRGVVPTYENVELQLAMYAGFTLLAENIIKIIIRLIKKYLSDT